MAKFDMTQLEKATTIPAGSLHLVEMGDGSGTKTVTQETLVEETGKALKIGDMAELQTEAKESLVAAINEAAQSGGGGTPVEVDVLDTQEEIEANTETGKAAGALAVKEMFGALNDNLKSYFQDSGWVSLGGAWPCSYRVKNGYLTVNIATSFSSAQTTGEKALGTIPLDRYGIKSIKQILVSEAQGFGYLMITSTGDVVLRTNTASKWYYVTAVIPID